MKTIIKKITSLVLFFVFTSSALFADPPTTVNVSLNDYTTQGQAPFTIKIWVTIFSTPDFGYGYSDKGADSDPCSIEVNWDVDLLPAGILVKVEKYDVNDTLVGAGQKLGGIYDNYQYVRLMFIIIRVEVPFYL